MILALGLALPLGATATKPAMAESSFAKFLRGGREPIRHGNYRSDKSPVPRKTVRFDQYPPNTIFIDTAERRLYYTIGNGKAIRYGVGVGRDGFRWSGSHKITRKAEWPGWTPPAVMRARVKRQTGKTLPAYVPGGEDNPLGARALYIGSTIYRIHGTNQPWTIGKAMSSGCIRMANEDVIDLYQRANVGTRVVVRQ
ncbi:L,D-transpeptidase [Notoacmeibacter ruber]|uniref:L,D-transpeptidase n=2 Tax=Notoacmeibacter ruber TaxID=2670375 RepID=A0A3L7JFA8_9HYPH|nr:L,D-transpeptidase [Notoacmeibacter ruber]